MPLAPPSRRIAASVPRSLTLLATLLVLGAAAAVPAQAKAPAGADRGHRSLTRSPQIRAHAKPGPATRSAPADFGSTPARKAGAKVAQECSSRHVAKARTEEVVDLCRDMSRGDERAPGSPVRMSGIWESARGAALSGRRSRPGGSASITSVKRRIPRATRGPESPRWRPGQRRCVESPRRTNPLRLS